MLNKNQYMDEVINQALTAEETYKHYFYVMGMKPLKNFLRYSYLAPFFNKHMIVCFTNKRILIFEMSGTTGKLTGESSEMLLSDVKQVTVKKGIIKTKITVTLSDNSVVLFTPNNFCVGLSNHKDGLLALKQLY